MNIYIVTGTTRGIGRALAEAVVAGKDFLLTLSSAPDTAEPFCHNVQCDLSRPEMVAAGLERLVKSISLEETREIILINNAGLLEPMGPLDTIEQDQILKHLMVNQAAPAILISAFIRLTRGFMGQRRIINISSGAGRHPYAGWAMYCASKAALDMMTRCVAAEQQLRKDPVAICAVSPGKVETQMQVRIRASDLQSFPAREDFVQARQRGELITPDDAARMIMVLDKSGYFKTSGLYDLRTVWSTHAQTDLPSRSVK